MRINYNDPNPGRWFELDKDTAICVRIINSKFAKSISKVPAEEKELKIWDYCIVDWRGLLDEAGEEEIPCTFENKVKLMTESVDFAMTINYLIGKINEDTKKYKEDLEKNLSTT